MESLTNKDIPEPLEQKIFLLLSDDTLLECRSVSQSWKHVLDSPRFWLKRMELKGKKIHFTNSEIGTYTETEMQLILFLQVLHPIELKRGTK